MACNRSQLALLALPFAFFAAESTAEAAVAYVRSEVGGSPWNTTDNEQAMDLVFGAGNWDDLRFESVAPATLFSNAYTFIYIDGSDSGAIDLQTFLMANQGAMETWVSNGGHLFLNCAPNEGTQQDWGFFGTQLVLTFPGDPAMPYDASHQIWVGPFLPINTVVSGGSYAHANITGGGLVPLIVDDAGLAALSELPMYGSGQVIFGGLTSSSFWITPQDGLDLRANILWYLGQEDADVDGVIDSEDVCVMVADPDQEDGDTDGIGDACDPCAMDPDNDVDADIVCGDLDNCPEALNFNQADSDRDGAGDVCDACPTDADDDADGDGVCGDVDLCPDVADPDQADADGDGIGDACDESSEDTGGPPDTGDPPDTSGDDGPLDTTTGLDTTATSVTATGDDTGGATDQNRGDDGGGCGCTTRSPARDVLWLALVIMPALRRRRAQEGLRR